MPQTFGDLLRQLRKRAGMTQHDLAAATGYSRALIGALEQNTRLPDVEAVIHSYLSALNLHEEPLLAVQLVELAARARGEQPPVLPIFSLNRQSATTTETEPHRLPLPPTQLLGREQTIKEISNRLLGHHGRLLTLVGPPGVGKTRLAQAVGSELQHMYRHGAVFIPLAAVSDPALVATSVSNALKLQDAAGKPAQTRLIDYLRRKELLLLLDNFEQIIAAAPLVAELLAECAGLRIVVTSRERLHLRAEQRYQVLPLALDSAVELFVLCAQAVDSHFLLTQHNRPLLEAICERLDRLPLALELCAAQIELFGPTQLLHNLQTRPLDLLVGGAQDLPPQQRTLRAAIHHSYRSLAEQESRLLRSLGVFRGGFALQEITAIMEGRWESAGARVAAQPFTHSITSLLHSLVSKSLIHRQTALTGEQRFFLLETIREFALEQLRAHDEEAPLSQRHFDTYLRLARTGDSHLRGPEAISWFQRLDAEQDNLAAALQYALEHGRYEDLAWLGIALFWYWQRRGHVQEAMLWMTPLLPHRHRLPSDLQLAYLHILFTSWAVLGEFHQADQYRQEIVQLAQACENQNLRAATLLAVAISTPDFNQAAVAFEETIAMARQIQDRQRVPDGFCIIGNDTPHLLASALHWFGELRLGQGDYGQATVLCTESLTILRAMENCDTIAYPLGNLGRLALIRGDLAQAYRWITEAVRITQYIGNQFGLAYWLPWLARTQLYLGESEIAWQLFNQARQLCFDISYYPILPNICIGLATIAMQRTDLDQAKQMIDEALSGLVKARWVTAETVEGLLCLTRLAIARQQYIYAATTSGLVSRLQTEIHHTFDAPTRPLFEEALTTVQAALEPAVFAAALAAGQQMTMVEAFALLQSTDHTGKMTSTPWPS